MGKKVNWNLIAVIINGCQKSFWKNWNSVFSRRIHSKTDLNNLTGKDVICHGFADYF